MGRKLPLQNLHAVYAHTMNSDMFMWLVPATKGVDRRKCGEGGLSAVTWAHATAFWSNSRVTNAVQYHRGAEGQFLPTPLPASMSAAVIRRFTDLTLSLAMSFIRNVMLSCITLTGRRWSAAEIDDRFTGS